MATTAQEILERARAQRDAEVARAEADKAAKIATARAEADALVEAARRTGDTAKAEAGAAGDARKAAATQAADALKAQADAALAAQAAVEAELAVLVATVEDAQKDTKVAASLEQDLQEPVIMGIPEDRYQAVVDNMVAAPTPYRLYFVNGYSAGGAVHFNTLWVRRDEADVAAVSGWAANHGVSGDTIDGLVAEMAGKGLALVRLDSYVRDGVPFYAPIFVMPSEPLPDRVFHTGLGVEANGNRHLELVEQGYRPVSVTSAYLDEGISVSALYDRKDVGAWEVSVDVDGDHYQGLYQECVAAGLGLAYLDVKTDTEGTPRFNAIWDARSPTDAVARHHLDDAAYHAEYMRLAGEGYELRLIFSYQHRDVVNHAALWVRPAA